MDRSLGLHDVPAVFRDAGFDVVLMRELYPDGQDQAVGDDEWIADVSQRGWVAFTKDAAIRRAHAAALQASRLRLFALPNANMTGAQMADRFAAHLEAIVARASDDGPYVTCVYAEGLQTMWPTS